MCGITGIIDLSHQTDERGLNETIKRMNDALSRRGPDDEGAWVCGEEKLALGQRRLAVLELSELGHQPILSSSKRYAMTFNGEIYNFVELANELQKYRNDFAPSSDTQVLTAAFEQWGFHGAVSRLEGMFAILCFDQKQKVLHLARDRLGEKPLYFGCHENRMLFASELKAMHGVFDVKPDVNLQSLTLFLRHGYVPGPQSIYQNIFKLPPGTMLDIDVKGVRRYIENPALLLSAMTAYWKLPVHKASDSGRKMNQVDFEVQLQGVVERQMRSDVDLGAFLSGGVDSSTIVALMQRSSSEQVRTFSIGFEDENFNEAPYAKAVAEHLNTDHHEQIVSAKEVMDIIPDLAQIYDEPFGDSSQLPTILVSRMAREHVTVCLSGDGGDELFGGYERYYWAEKVWRCCGWMSQTSRGIVASLLKLIAAADSQVLPNGIRQHLGKIQRLAALLPESDRQQFYRGLISSHCNPSRFVLGGSEPEYALTRPALSGEPYLHQMMFLDLHNYLPDDILTKVDRASMYSSLELRAPLLDHHIVETAWQLRSDNGDYQTHSKVALRTILYQLVPKSLIERPKKGFAIPLRNWLRGPLRQWAEGHINPSRIKHDGFLDSDRVMSVWNDFQNGKPGAEHFLWNVLMFQLWYENWRE
ncbi:MAG: asparagine synthase (glutamine-hydrolyzing) [Gammaproteobacteria bacterium]|nr:asparagine synthase (glutamine-hydrolyzing) [Gammaproteobacteria bacterium]